jgi:hypothetical protein
LIDLTPLVTWAVGMLAAQHAKHVVEEVRPAPLPVVAPPVPTAPRSVEETILEVFGPDGRAALEVADCESDFRITAANGQHKGIFQLGARERARYGHGEDARTQVEAAHELFLDRGWQPWKACR